MHNRLLLTSKLLWRILIKLFPAFYYLYRSLTVFNFPSLPFPSLFYNRLKISKKWDVVLFVKNDCLNRTKIWWIWKICLNCFLVDPKHTIQFKQWYSLFWLIGTYGLSFFNEVLKYQFGWNGSKLRRRRRCRDTNAKTKKMNSTAPSKEQVKMAVRAVVKSCAAIGSTVWKLGGSCCCSNWCPKRIERFRLNEISVEFFVRFFRAMFSIDKIGSSANNGSLPGSGLAAFMNSMFSSSVSPKFSKQMHLIWKNVKFYLIS